ncbi:MAG: SUMF1/EgtB/PvdO family nonheme iron enzyme [Hyphomonadaceae bacterium]|nr:SUMF1/EgtB/PvdO family nonheme iron enzyme [Hyphomonadaceae bacterium]
MLRMWIVANAALALLGVCATASAQQSTALATVYAPPQLPPRNETPEARRARWEAWRAVNADIDARIAMFLRDTEARIAEYRNRPVVDRFAALREGVTAARRREALTYFSNAFLVWQAEDFAAAEIGFRRGLEIDPTNGSANFYMGDLLRRRGDNAGARDYFERSVAFGAGSTEALRAEAALAQLPAGGDPEINEPPVIWDAVSRPSLLWDCADCPELLIIPAGAFTMGSSIPAIPSWAPPGPEHRVTLDTPFAVGRFEVTRAQYTLFVRATERPLVRDCAANAFHNVTWRNPGFSQTEADPVICITWIDAQAYLQWLSEQTGRTYRLLTEEEWEYAARAGTSSDYYWGSDTSQICSNENVADESWMPSHPERMTTGNFEGFSCNDGFVATAPIASYRSNGFGLYDMLGNASEWVNDCSRRYNSAQTDCTARTIRGGSFDGAWNYRAVHRSAGRTDDMKPSWGFRVARTL